MDQNLHHIPQTLLETRLLDIYRPDYIPEDWLTPSEILLAMGISRETPDVSPTKLGNLLSKKGWFKKRNAACGTQYFMPKQRSNFYT